MNARMYRVFRTIHLLLASFSVPFLLMYAVSAVQMSHNKWFTMRPAVHEEQLMLRAGETDARAVARDLTRQRTAVRGELTNVQAGGNAIALRLVVPGTVHEVRYEPVSGATHIKTSVAGFMGMLNRLHHAAGVFHDLGVMNAWGAAVALVSVALVLLGATGIGMWFMRRQERLSGAILLALNLVVAISLLVMMRRAGP